MASADAAASEAETQAGPDGAPPERFAFAHKLFRSSDDCLFRRAADGSKEPVFVLTIDDSEYVLPLDGIKAEFGLAEDSPDARMLALVEEALHYQRVIRPGDPVPREMVTGEASWEITDDHRRIAHQRINVQLTHWLAGDGELITDPDQLEQIAGEASLKSARAYGRSGPPSTWGWAPTARRSCWTISRPWPRTWPASRPCATTWTASA